MTLMFDPSHQLQFAEKSSATEHWPAVFAYLGADTRETECQLDHIRKNGLEQMLSLCIFKNLLKRKKEKKAFYLRNKD